MKYRFILTWMWYKIQKCIGNNKYIVAIFSL